MPGAYDTITPFACRGDNSPSAVRVTEITLGALLLVAGALMPRIQGPLELSATGIKGQVDQIRTELIVGKRAAENVIPEGEPDREERAKEAAVRAVLDSSIWHELSHAQLQGSSFRGGTPLRPTYYDTDVLWYLLSMDLPKRPKPPDEPPDEPPLAAKPS